MQRLHLFEFNDMSWLPRTWREAMTGYLEVLGRWAGAYDGVEPLLREALATAPTRRFVDLCSGGGGPWPDLAPAFDDASVVLTDLHAVTTAVDGLQPWAEPVDALAVPPELGGVRTIFNGFHHFVPADAAAVLADAFKQRQPIVIVELSERRIHNLLSGPIIWMLFVIAILFVRPFRLSWILWCWLVPVVTAMVVWDGIVSHWRVYTPAELEGMVAGLQADDYVWKIGQLKAGPGRLTYLQGLPRDERSPAGETTV